ncbi:MAG: hypothetical protein P9X24_01070 [Candidatus Hatepunaea meridiana]|nr:hypothetical protein [Candidatus Hatepunaea meridiana]
MYRFKIIFIVVLSLFAFHNTFAMDLSIIPRGGLSQPVGSIADTWQAGYNIELNVFRPIVNDFTWGARLGFHRWKPNAEELLKTNSREFEVEQSIGWHVIVEASGLVSYRLLLFPNKLGSLCVEGGAGVFYIRQPDILIKGFHAVGYTALNREVTLEHNIEVVPGFSAGLSLEIISRIEALVRYNYIFTADEGTSMLTVGLGLLMQ